MVDMVEVVFTISLVPDVMVLVMGHVVRVVCILKGS